MQDFDFIRATWGSLVGAGWESTTKFSYIYITALENYICQKVKLSGVILSSSL